VVTIMVSWITMSSLRRSTASAMAPPTSAKATVGTTIGESEQADGKRRAGNLVDLVHQRHGRDLAAN